MAQHSNLFVGSLPQGLDEPTLMQMFQGFGTVVSMKLVADRRFAFVKFSSQPEAEAAIVSLNGAELGGSTIVVKFADNDRGAGKGGGYGKASSPMEQAPPNTNLYVKGLPAGMTQDNIRDTFGRYGTVTSVRVLNDTGITQDGQGMTIAFVRFEQLEEAAWCVENLHGNIFEGLTVPLTVKFANQGGGGKGKDGGPGLAGPYGANGAGGACGAAAAGGAWTPTWAGGCGPAAAGGGSGQLIPGLPSQIEHGPDHSNLYVKNLPRGADDLYLYRAFAPFGCVFSVNTVQKDGFTIGFVRYRSNEEALNAIANVNGLTLTDGNMLDVSVKTDNGPGQGQMESGGQGAWAGAAKGDPSQMRGQTSGTAPSNDWETWMSNAGVGIV